jgi:hypothetical protein
MQNLSEAETLVVIVHFVVPLLCDYRGQLLAGETFCQQIRFRRPFSPFYPPKTGSIQASEGSMKERRVDKPPTPERSNGV